MEVTCKTRERALTFSLWTVTGRARGNAIADNPLLVNFSARSRESYRSAAQWLRIEVFKIGTIWRPFQFPPFKRWRLQVRLSRRHHRRA
jgi:hypothetical protein